MFMYPLCAEPLENTRRVPAFIIPQPRGFSATFVRFFVNFFVNFLAWGKGKPLYRAKDAANFQRKNRDRIEPGGMAGLTGYVA